MFADYEAKLLQQGRNNAQLDEQAQSRLRRMKVACIKWRADYQAEVERRYESNASSLDTRYMVEIKRLAEELSDAREQKQVMAEQLADRKHQRLQQGLKERRGADQAHASAHRTEATNQEGESEQQQTRDALVGLWSSMQPHGLLSAEEKVEELLRCIDAVPYSAELLAQLKRSHAMYSSRQEVNGLCTRREYLLYQLKADDEQHPQRPNGQQRHTPAELQARTQLLHEIHQLSSELHTELVGYEETYAPVRFMHNGVAYLDSLNDQINKGAVPLPTTPMEHFHQDSSQVLSQQKTPRYASPTSTSALRSPMPSGTHSPAGNQAGGGGGGGGGGGSFRDNRGLSMSSFPPPPPIDEPPMMNADVSALLAAKREAAGSQAAVNVVAYGGSEGNRPAWDSKTHNPGAGTPISGRPRRQQQLQQGGGGHTR
jgi:hypothetical protein